MILSAATVCTCLSYLFLGGTSGFVLNIVCLVRNLCFYFRKEGTWLHGVFTGVFMMAMIALGAASWQNFFSLFLIVALTVNTLFVALGKPQTLRFSILFTSALVIVYNVSVLSVGGILSETLAILSSTVGIYRFRKESDGQA